MPKITIRVANAEKLETQFLPELASGGLFIRSDKFLPLGAEVDIDLYLPSATEALPLRGRVTKVIDDDSARARKATGMSLSVDANSEPTRSRLEALYTAYRIPVRRAPPGDVTPGRPSQGAYSTGNAAIPLPAPAALGASVGAVPLPPPDGMGNALPDADDDLPSPRAPPPSVAPAIPSIAPSIAPAGHKTPPAVPVVRFDKPASTGSDGASPEHHDVDPYEDTSPPALADQSIDDVPVRRAGANTPPPPPPADVPGFDALTHKSAASSAGNTAPLESRIKELEAAESKARAEARKATADREGLETKHAEATKRLNDELAALKKRPAAGGKQGNPLPAALLGLAIGAGAMFAYFTFMRPAPETTPVFADNSAGKATPTDATGSAGSAEMAVGSTGAGATGVMVAAVDAGSGGGAVADMALTGGSVRDAGSAVAVAAAFDAGSAVAVVKPDAGNAVAAQTAEVGGGKVGDENSVADTKPPDVAVNEEADDEEPPPLTGADTQPPVEQKQVAKKGPAPLGDDAGVLNLRADMPASVYVNGRRVGNAPALGVKANPGRVTVRFDCIVEDVRVRGRNRTVNLAPNGTANVDFSCIE